MKCFKPKKIYRLFFLAICFFVMALVISSNKAIPQSSSSSSSSASMAFLDALNAIASNPIVTPMIVGLGIYLLKLLQDGMRKRQSEVIISGITNHPTIKEIATSCSKLTTQYNDIQDRLQSVENKQEQHQAKYETQLSSALNRIEAHQNIKFQNVEDKLHRLYNRVEKLESEVEQNTTFRAWTKGKMSDRDQPSGFLQSSQNSGFFDDPN